MVSAAAHCHRGPMPALPSWTARVRLPARLHRRRAEPLPGVIGVARVSRQAREVATRIAPGEIAVLDEVDLDRDGARALVARQVAAVVNVAPSISGRYPALGLQT